MLCISSTNQLQLRHKSCLNVMHQQHESAAAPSQIMSESHTSAARLMFSMSRVQHEQSRNHQHQHLRSCTCGAGQCQQLCGRAVCSHANRMCSSGTNVWCTAARVQSISSVGIGSKNSVSELCAAKPIECAAPVRIKSVHKLSLIHI